MLVINFGASKVVVRAIGVGGSGSLVRRVVFVTHNLLSFNQEITCDLLCPSPNYFGMSVPLPYDMPHVPTNSPNHFGTSIPLLYNVLCFPAK